MTDDDSDEWEEEGASEEEANSAIAKLEAELGIPGGLGLGKGGCTSWHSLLFSQISGIPEISPGLGPGRVQCDCIIWCPTINCAMVAF